MWRPGGRHNYCIFHFGSAGASSAKLCLVWQLGGSPGGAGKGSLVHLPLEILPEQELLQRQQERAAERDRISGRLAAAVAEEPYSLQLVRASGVRGAGVGRGAMALLRKFDFPSG